MQFKTKLILFILSFLALLIAFPVVAYLGFKFESNRTKKTPTGIQSAPIRVPIVVAKKWELASNSQIDLSFAIEANGTYSPEATAEIQFMDSQGEILDRDVIDTPITEEVQVFSETLRVYAADRVDMFNVEIKH